MPPKQFIIEDNVELGGGYISRAYLVNNSGQALKVADVKSVFYSVATTNADGNQRFLNGHTSIAIDPATVIHDELEPWSGDSEGHESEVPGEQGSPGVNFIHTLLALGTQIGKGPGVYKVRYTIFPVLALPPIRIVVVLNVTAPEGASDATAAQGN